MTLQFSCMNNEAMRPCDLWLSRRSVCRRQLRRKPGRKPEGTARKISTASCATMQRRCAAALSLRAASALPQPPSGPSPCPALPRQPGQALERLQKKGELPLFI